MRVTYLRLENVSGLWVGSERTKLEISFERSKNKIVAIQGANGTGKTVLISSISPFASVTSLDERSSLSYIIPGKSGYKEIHYQNGDDQFIIKHYYKPKKDGGHTVKSYFIMNGQELNENGNVGSFLALVEMHLGLTQEMMRLVRLGTNVNSFITLDPAKRKEYIGKLIEEIETYLQIYKKVNEDIRFTRTLLNANHQNLYNCHITDLVLEQETLKHLEKQIKKEEGIRDKIISRIGEIDSLMRTNNVDELRQRRQSAQAGLIEFVRTEDTVKSLHLQNTTVDQLLKRRSELSDEKADVQGKENGYRISIDNTLKRIEQLELAIKKITSNNDIQSLQGAIEELKVMIQNTPPIIQNFHSLGSSSEDILTLLNQLRGYNQISQMLYTLGNKPVDVYLKLIHSGESVDKFLRTQARKRASGLNESDMKILFDQVFGDDMIITPNCATEYVDCPYYRFSETIMSVKEKLEGDTYDDETLRYIQIVATNVDNVLNGIDQSRRINLPDKIRDDLTEKRVLDRLGQKLPFFDLSDLEEYLTIVKEWEVYCQRFNQLRQYETQLSMYKSSGIDNHMAEIDDLRQQGKFYRDNITTLNHRATEIQMEINQIDTNIGIVTKYLEGKKSQALFKTTLDDTEKILKPLEKAGEERRELEFQLRSADTNIQGLRQRHKELEAKITEYERLVSEGAKLEKKYADLAMIQEAVSTKKGIPVIYMKSYLGRIQQLTNDLLKLIYDDDLQLANFKVTQDTFEVPYIKNGTKVPDVKYSSQSEVALITMALSFALASRASGAYNILLLDEIDAGLDEANRSAFLKMLYMQMSALKAEQVFIISHNLTQMVNVPMDCIRLSDAGVKSRLQNIIYG